MTPLTSYGVVTEAARIPNAASTCWGWSESIFFAPAGVELSAACVASVRSIESLKAPLQCGHTVWGKKNRFTWGKQKNDTNSHPRKTLRRFHLGKTLSASWKKGGVSPDPHLATQRARGARSVIFRASQCLTQHHHVGNVKSPNEVRLMIVVLENGGKTHLKIWCCEKNHQNTVFLNVFGEKTHQDMLFVSGIYPLVNVKKLWKDPPCVMGKSTISMAIFHKLLNLLIYQRVMILVGK